MFSGAHSHRKMREQNYLIYIPIRISGPIPFGKILICHAPLLPSPSKTKAPFKPNQRARVNHVGAEKIPKRINSAFQAREQNVIDLTDERFDSQ